MLEILNKYPEITLDEMKDVRLLNRTDTKYVTTTSRLRKFLLMAEGDYYVQVTGGMRMQPYHTIYLDTPEQSMYMAHHDGKKHRYKVRMRTYEVSGQSFLEVKDKNNHGRTKKKRIEIADLIYKGSEMLDFVNMKVPYDATMLKPSIENYFRRVTLVNKAKTERLTIDTELSFNNLRTHNECSLGNKVVIELKRDGLVYSPVLQMLRQLRIQPHGFSKYCMGSALTGQDHLPVNRFKCKLIEINKLVNQ